MSVISEQGIYSSLGTPFSPSKDDLTKLSIAGLLATPDANDMVKLFRKETIFLLHINIANRLRHTFLLKMSVSPSKFYGHVISSICKI